MEKYGFYVHYMNCIMIASWGFFLCIADIVSVQLSPSVSLFLHS